MVDFLEKEALFKKGRLLYESDDYAGAQAVFEKILSEDPRDFLSLNYLGLCRLESGRFEEAVTSFSDAEKCAEESSAADNGKITLLQNKGICYERWGKSEREKAGLYSGEERKRLLLEASEKFRQSEIIELKVSIKYPALTR
jgi:tetratricopeptide (TPR) repeat protein